MKQKSYRNAILAKIHTHPTYKKIYGMGIWKDYLYSKFKAMSCRDLDMSELFCLLDCLNGKEEGPKAESRQDRKIVLLAQSLGMKSLSAFIYRQTKKRRLEECSKEEKTKIIIGLEKITREKR